MMCESLMPRLFRTILPLLCMIACMVMMALGWSSPAAAEMLRIGHALCHAVSQAVAQGDRAPSPFACRGAPLGYQKGTLWLRATLPARAGEPDDLSLIVHSSRFDRLGVAFTFADGAVERQHVRSGDFGPHWRAGGQLAFRAPRRDAALTAVTLRFDKVASARLLRIRLVGEAQKAPRRSRFIITPGQTGDVTQAPALLHGQESGVVLADKAYDSNALRTIIAKMGPKRSYLQTAAVRSPSRMTR